jgi:hypothetical protein
MRHRLAVLGDDDPFAGAGDFVHHGEALGLELGSLHHFGHTQPL